MRLEGFISDLSIEDANVCLHPSFIDAWVPQPFTQRCHKPSFVSPAPSTGEDKFAIKNLLAELQSSYMYGLLQVIPASAMFWYKMNDKLINLGHTHKEKHVALNLAHGLSADYLFKDRLSHFGAIKLPHALSKL